MVSRHNGDVPRIAAPTVEEHRRVRRQQILDATIELLRSGGSVTMAAIADTSGLPRTTVYEYFASADQIIDQAREYRDEPLRLLARRALRHPDDITVADFRQLLTSLRSSHANALADYIWSILVAHRSDDPSLTVEVVIGIARLGLEPRQHSSEEL